MSKSHEKDHEMSAARSLWQAVPYRSVGPIAFGMSDVEVNDALGMPYTRRIGDRDGFGWLDWYEGVPMSVSFRRGRCVAVTLFSAVIVDDVDLFGMSARRLRDWARSRAGSLDNESCGFFSRKLGLAMDAPWIDVDDVELAELDEDPERPAEAVTCFSQDYVDDPIGGWDPAQGGKSWA
ncbi:MAG: hypothetical protein K8W52_36805 [Deltaproteobacteria bacterium]|nr:hypothetical protein [Deltaproteobacteria bacterium]